MLIEIKRRNYQIAVNLGERGSTLDPDALYMKAQLSLAYHLNKQFIERDSVIKELTDKNYPYVADFKRAFEGQVTFEDF